MPIDIVEMFWECTHCKRPNLGRNKICGGPSGKCTDGGHGCGKNKTDDCREWLPDDVSHGSASVVHEDEAPELFKKFVAGPDWKCRFCGCLEWKVDGSCANCCAPNAGEEQRQLAELARESHDDGRPSTASPEPRVVLPPAPRTSSARSYVDDSFEREVDFMVNRPAWTKYGLAAAALAAALGLGYCALRPVEHPATVTDTVWTYTVHVSRNQKVPDSGFDVPAGAEDIFDEGQRVHHYNHVIDHYTTVWYDETVRDPDTCVTTPRVCRDVPRVCRDIPKTCRTTPRSCTSNKNGSATCSGGDTVCSGGGQSCSGGGQSCSGGDRRCTPNSHLEHRSRQEPIYRDDPVYRNHFRWTTWQWVPNRNVPASAHDVNPRPPASDEINLGDRERATFDLTCRVTFTADDDHVSHEHKPADCAGAFQALPIGTKKRIKVGVGNSIEILAAK